MFEAIAEKDELEELRGNFDAEADARFANIVKSGKTIPWPDMGRYLEDRVAGKQVVHPVAKKERA